MQTVILAGGKGSRMSLLSGEPPKALVKVAGRPLIEHVMNIYRDSGFNHFLVATGHKHAAIHEYFENDKSVSAGLIQCVFTGETTRNGGRLKRLQHFIDGDTFMMTWTDGVADIDIHALISFHRQHGKMATLTAVNPPPRFGHLTLTEKNEVVSFEEKPENREAWVNGAFFVLNRQVFDLIDGDACEFERDVLTRLAGAGQLMAYRHTGMWRCVDAPVDIQQLELMERQTGLLTGLANVR